MALHPAASPYIDAEAEASLLGFLAAGHAQAATWDGLSPLLFAAGGNAERFLAIQCDRPTGQCASIEVSQVEESQPLIAHLRDLAARRIRAVAAFRLQQCLADLTTPAAAADLDAIWSDASRQIAELHPTPTWDGDGIVQRVVEDVTTRLERYATTGETLLGVPVGGTALRPLDHLLGGLRPGSLTLLGGPPGTGKTNLSTQFAESAARAGYSAVYVTLENSAAQLVLRGLCRGAGLDSMLAERGLLPRTSLPKLAEAAAHYRREILPRLVLVDDGARTTFDSIRRVAAQLRQRFDRPLLIAIDYLQRFAALHATGYDSLRADVDATTTSLRDLARDLEAAVLAVVSLARSGYERTSNGRSKQPDLFHLKESGALEYDADVVMLLSPDGDRTTLPPARALRLEVAKHRFGPLGSFPLIFRADSGAFALEAH